MSLQDSPPVAGLTKAYFDKEHHYACQRAAAFNMMPQSKFA
jgi:hypothetical protein